MLEPLDGYDFSYPEDSDELFDFYFYLIYDDYLGKDKMDC
jgi:hypothetical protein